MIYSLRYDGTVKSKQTVIISIMAFYFGKSTDLDKPKESLNWGLA